MEEKKEKPSASKPQNSGSSGLRLTIGAKVLLLLTSALLVTAAAVVFNATSMFKKDNLNNIYLSSDLMTASKAGEVRFWLDGAIKKGTVVGAILSEQVEQARRARTFRRFRKIKNSKPKTNDLDRFKGDQDLLFVRVYGTKTTGKTQSYVPQGAWFNESLAKEMGLSPQALLKGSLKSDLKIQRIAAGLSEVKTLVLSGGQPVLLVNLPFASELGGATALTLGLKQDRLLQSFSDTGPYTLSLVNNEGRLIAHPDVTRVIKGENMLRVPVVAKMLTSPVDREFQEFTLDHKTYLGSYAKVGFAGLGVVSQVPKAIAFETGDLLVKRSIWIAVFILSAVFIFAYFVVLGIVSPVHRLRAASHEISRGNFDVRVSVKSRDEMRDLAASFNVMTEEIGRKIENLSKINEAAHVISSTFESRKLLELSADTLRGLTKAKRAMAWVSEDGKMAPVEVSRDWYESGPMSDLAGKVLQAGDRPFLHQVGEKETLVAPICEKGEVRGYVLLSERGDGKKFQEEDIFIAGTLGSSVSTTFENIKLLKETADRARMEKELETAKHVQDTMFPPAEIRVGGLEIQSYYTPAAECGGDWWGYVELPDGKVLLAIGDATGHGAPSAMVTATAKASISVLHEFASKSKTLASSPRVILNMLNKAVFESTKGKVLMTFFIGIFDTRTGQFTYATASHDPIYWYKRPEDAVPGSPGDKSNIDVLACEPGPRLGQNAESYYEQAQVTLSPGDFLVLYTDGLPEGNNPAQEEYGERKFLRSIAKYANQPPAAIREGLLTDFRAFVAGEPLHDDITLAICKFEPPVS